MFKTRDQIELWMTEVIEGDRAAALFELTGGLPMRSIFVGGKPYMERYFLADERGGSRPRVNYLHRFVGFDGDRHLHNHPWPFAEAVIISGGYSELRLKAGQRLREVERRELRAGDHNLIEADDLHQIVTIEPETWTWFSHADWNRGWGFINTSDPDSPAIPIIQDDAPRTHKDWWRTYPLGKEHPDRQALVL